MSASPARRAAFETVQRVFDQEAYADRAFPAAAAGLEPRERALAQRLAYGTIQRVRTLDHGIEALGPSWTEPGRQVVSGPFRVAERTPEGLVLERRGNGPDRRAGCQSRGDQAAEEDLCEGGGG
jgi:hypothetical protein